ncbi:hypothetical protein K5V07_00540 [Flavobacterium sp. CHNK8]|uniref:hypothetical protein n=1 Tax=Flavobacterium sp. CHNK8 TaxID=2871165 RepID=UPI001C8D9FE7|nr:hypothetical protein [Flavobacterium sp. CHNK8]QZK89057.1 hypothetical protein K5V07_00540 [Flavobacterium sp. CHNK8]
MIELILNLSNANQETKAQIEELLINAYIAVQNLRKMTLAKSLTITYIEEVEQLFMQNQFITSELQLPKYLQRYSECLSNFWGSYSYNKSTQLSRGKFNLFDSLKEYDFPMKVHHSEVEISKILRKMEDYWIASNQVYTKYQVSLIKEKYLR